ncbi:N-acetylmuramoyl-L-alanine amidase [Bacillus sp. 31A1R]|uniref:N-acetylmuramoyl-L-alanine amidase n=1 Tax=Robertmurraya mangrovi TaxID=3098077 RepID=A0ABU5IWS4_9BACI|nr:N-acetylmuramoyl-L-alanine amidase [Bacillus sp. 31A1R]MDZ5471585.1 N-acetylmuramoyl-L-alanine amidase [Bacillus sp. 31A1R]
MVKIFIDPGHGGSDSGAVGNGLQEKNVTLQIARRVRSILLKEYEDVSIRMSRTGDQTVSLSQRTNAANSWGADFFLSIHINAGGGRGFESYVYPNVGRPTTTYQSYIHSEVLKQVNFQDRGKKQSNFHVLRETNMDAILTENGFIDNSSDASILKSNVEKIARGHVNGLVRAFKLKKTATQAPDSDSDSGSRAGNTGSQTGKLFRVQIGAFQEESNANRLARRAREKQLPTYVFEDDGLFRVQIGAFSDRKRAEEYADRVRNAGFNVFIRQD